MQRNRDGHAAIPHIFLAHRATPYIQLASGGRVVDVFNKLIKESKYFVWYTLNAWLVFDLLINYKVLF